MNALPFPGGTSVTRLRVYDADTLGPAADGLLGGTPHLHTVSTEAYAALGGAGAVQLLDRTGYREVPLVAGSVVWFGPGTIHRAVNHGGLDVLAILSNRGLPEAGDAVVTFPEAVLASPDAYARAAALGDDAAAGARRRRALGVEGYRAVRDAFLAGDAEPLERLLAQASALVGPRAADFAERRAASVGADEELGTAALAALTAGEPGILGSLEPRSAALEHEPVHGMCGLLQRLDAD